jgi:hypothetical protein
MRAKHTPTSGRGNVPVARPAPPRQRYPLAIVLDHPTWRRWLAFKRQVNRSRDREAFAILLARATAEGSFPPASDATGGDDAA